VESSEELPGFIDSIPPETFSRDHGTALFSLNSQATSAAALSTDAEILELPDSISTAHTSEKWLESQFADECLPFVHSIIPSSRTTRSAPKLTMLPMIEGWDGRFASRGKDYCSLEAPPMLSRFWITWLDEMGIVNGLSKTCRSFSYTLHYQLLDGSISRERRFPFSREILCGTAFLD